MRTALLILSLSLVAAGVVRAAEPLPATTALSQKVMTVEQFRKIADMPGDALPLMPQLADIPFWPKATTSNVTTSVSSGRVYREELAVTAKTVGGKYLVFTVQSPASKEASHGILTYDPTSSALKVYGLYNDGHGGDALAEGTTIYDHVKKTYTTTSTYGGDFKEITTGTDTSAQNTEETAIYQNGVLFGTRETITRPVLSLK